MHVEAGTILDNRRVQSMTRHRSRDKLQGQAKNSTAGQASSGTQRVVAPLAVMLLVGLAVRIALLFMWQGEEPRIADEQDYDKIAVNLVERGEYAIFPGHPCSARPPLYPAFVAAVYQVAGVRNYQAVRGVQVLLGLVLVVQTYLFARRLYNPRVGLWAAALTCFYPSLVGFEYLLLSEVLFAVLLMAGLLALQRHLQKPSYWQLAWCGVWLGLATLARSVLWPFVPLLALAVFCMARGQRWPRRLAEAAIVTLAFVLTLAPWSVRTIRFEQAFIPVDTLGGRNMMMGNYEHTKLYRTWDTVAIRGPKQWNEVLARETPGYRQLTQGQRDKLAMQRGVRFALENPGLTAQRDIIKFFNFWQLERTLMAGLADGRWGQQPKLLVLGVGALTAGTYAVTLLLGVFGFVVLPPEERRLHWFLLLLVGFVCAVHTVVFGHERYHLSLMPIIFAYSAAAFVGLRDLW